MVRQKNGGKWQRTVKFVVNTHDKNNKSTSYREYAKDHMDMPKQSVATIRQATSKDKKMHVV